MNAMFRALLVTTVLWSAPAFAEDAKPAEPAKDYVILKVGAEEIRHSEVMDVWKGLFPGGAAPDFASFDENIRQNVLRGMASERLIYQEAVKAGVDKSDEVKKRLESLQKQVVMQTFMEQKSKSLITDSQLKTAYNEKIAAMKGEEEVKARHILVTDEAEAKKIAEQIKKGGNFDAIAKEKSTGKASGENGGDLGWFTKDRMVPEFADAAFKLKKGEVSAPTKTAFGWHVIKLEDRRAIKPPTFDEMKETLKGEVTNAAMQTYVEGMLKSADLKYFAPDGTQKDFPAVAQPKSAPKEEAPAAGGEKAPKTN